MKKVLSFLGTAVMWGLTGFMSIALLVGFPVLSQVLALIFILIAVPIKPVQAFLSKLKIKGIVKFIILLVLFFAVFITAGGSNTGSTGNSISLFPVVLIGFAVFFAYKFTQKRGITFMAKCTHCGRKGLFLKLIDGLCDNCTSTALMKKEQDEISQKIASLSSELSDQQALFDRIEQEAKASALKKAEEELSLLTSKIETLTKECAAAQSALDTSLAEQQKAEKSAASATKKVLRSRELIKAIQNACDAFDTEERLSEISALASEIDDYLVPTVSLDLQCYDMRDLRKKYRENEKNIQATFEKYKDRYTTKANITIYRLMVIALAAELQNILHDISFGKLEDALKSVKTITGKYYAIATDGNQSIAPTLKKFIGELDYYFQNAVKIEYEYYVQKERAREEQRAIREQMRQEAEERRELERQQKLVEKEESKFQDQIKFVNEQIASSTDEAMIQKLKERVAELERQKAEVAEKKERIIQLQNGKAGNVYVISNLGAFGEDVFKIGMTRRADPMDRINELGNASVPFPFDVHSMIFSDDAVALETQLHHTLNDNRVNKVNLRKEFFRIDLDSLEKLVMEISPTASFKRTMLAEQYRQSLSISHVSENPNSYLDDYEDLAD